MIFAIKLEEKTHYRYGGGGRREACGEWIGLKSAREKKNSNKKLTKKPKAPGAL
jgi:hypothetical protein